MTECHKELLQCVDKPVSIITNDGRNIVGTLKGLDQKLNIILEECHERIFSKEAGVEQVHAYVFGTVSCLRLCFCIFVSPLLVL